MDTKTEMVNLLACVSVDVTKEDGSTESISVSQLSIKQYEAAFQKLDDEFALNAFICGKPKDWCYSLAPESYEAINSAVKTVNEKGFFVYADRRQAALIRRLNSVSPATLQAAIEKVSTNSSFESRMRPV